MERNAVEVVSGVWVTGGIPRTNDFEDVGGPFFLDEALSIPDPMAKDMGHYLPAAVLFSVILGCAQAGVVNTLDHISRQTGSGPVHTIIGGLHLAAATLTRMVRTVDALRSIAPERMGFCHCKGKMLTFLYSLKRRCFGYQCNCIGKKFPENRILALT